MTKAYDRAYFDRWYRGRFRVHTKGEVRRKIQLAVAMAEYFLRRPMESVLDVGAGEGAWLPHLRALRKSVSYLGVEPSDYAVERFGAERNLRKGSFAELPKLRLRKQYDLVVCSDVLHYLSQKEISQGIDELAALTGGVAYIEVLTEEDDIVGDLHGLNRRSADWYRRRFERAGFSWAGPYLWLGPRARQEASALEKG